MAFTSIVRYNFDGQTVGQHLANISPATQNATYAVTAGDTPVNSARLVIQSNGSLEELGDSLDTSGTFTEFAPLVIGAGSESDLQRANYYTVTARRTTTGTQLLTLIFRSNTGDGTLDDFYLIDVLGSTARLVKYVNGVLQSSTNFSATYNFSSTFSFTAADDGSTNPTFTVTQGATSSTITDSSSPLPIAGSYNGFMVYGVRHKLVNLEWFVDLAEPGGGGGSARDERQLVALRLLENEL